MKIVRQLNTMTGMCTKEIDENNYLLCEFLGLNPEAHGGRVTIDGNLWWAIKRVEGVGGAIYNSRPTLFHKDWNWLMVIVEKIFNSDSYRNYNSNITITPVIKDVYIQCVNFVRWSKLNK